MAMAFGVAWLSVVVALGVLTIAMRSVLADTGGVLTSDHLAESSGVVSISVMIVGSLVIPNGSGLGAHMTAA